MSLHRLIRVGGLSGGGPVGTDDEVGNRWMILINSPKSCGGHVVQQ
jgi:hypothetical protein